MRFLVSLFALLTLILSVPAAWGQRALRPGRWALVIGNDRYQSVAPLRRAVEDARLIAGSLRQAGFQVAMVENASREALDRAVDEFIDRLRAGDTAFVYYAGHGVEVNGGNYLLPVDVVASDAIQVRSRSLAAQELLDRMAARDTALQILVLDACRDNPFPRRSIGGGGLAAMTAGSGAFIAFSTSPRQTADDEGFYAKSLARALAAEGLRLEDVFKRVGSEVQSATARRQVPWLTSSVAGDFYFRGGAGRASETALPPAPPPAAIADQAWAAAAEANSCAAYQAFLAEYPQASQAGLARVKTAALCEAPRPARALGVSKVGIVHTAMAQQAVAGGARSGATPLPTVAGYFETAPQNATYFDTSNSSFPRSLGWFVLRFH